MDPTPSNSATIRSHDQQASQGNAIDKMPIHVTRGAREGQQLGNYRLVQLLAEGGFAEVYLGEHIHLNTYAAIKIVHAQLTAENLGAFREEARIVARLRHPHIVSILDFDVQNGTPFLVMDYAPNGTLRQRHPKGTTIPPVTILPYLTQAADALQYAHKQRLIHRDIKPENMLIGWQGEILLSDFGIAVVLQTSRSEMTQEVIGTVTYMSPEQFKGKPVPASDQYSLGVVVYEWLCGRCPFHGSIAEILAQHMNADVPSLSKQNPEIASELEQVVLKALAKEPEQRYPTILDFVKAFETACPQQALLLQHPTVIKPVQGTLNSSLSRRFSRRTLLLGLTGLTALGFIGGGLTWFVRSHPYKKPALSQLTPTPTPVPIGTLIFPYHGHTDVVRAVSWYLSGGTYIASASKDHTARVWYSSSGADAKSYNGHRDAVNAVMWSPDGQYIASCSNDKTVQVWAALKDGDPVLTYQGHGDVVNSVSWFPSMDANAQLVASGGNDKTVRVWKPQDGSDVLIYHKHTDAVRTIAWSPDGTYIASGSADKTVQVWDPKKTDDNTSPTVIFQGHSDAINAVAWSPDGKYIASAGADKIVLIWYALIGGNPVTYYGGHSGAVNAVSWSPDGSRIASAGDDGTVHIWNAADGSDVYAYNGHSPNGANAVYGVQWSPDGAYIASAGADKTVQVWYT